MFNSAQFRKNALKYAGINFDSGDVLVRNQLTVVSNTNFIGNYTGLPAVSRSDINGNLMGNFVDVSGNITTGFFFGDGSQITGISNGPLPSVIRTDVQGNLVGTNANVTGTMSTGSFFLGNGTFISNVVTVLPKNANADILRGNVTAAGNVDASNATARILRVSGSTFVTGQVNVTGNVSAAYLFGNGAFLTGVTADLPDSANMNIVGNVVGSNVTASNVSTGILRLGGPATVNGQVTVVGNVSGNLSGNGAFLTSVFTGNLSRDVIGNVTASGNIFAGLFVGNGTFLQLNGSIIQPQGNVLDQAQRLALNASIGTVVTQDDINRQFMLTSLPPSSNANWLQFSGNNFPVTSLFGRLGDVVLISGTDIQSIQGQSISGSGDITSANIDIRGNVLAPANVIVTNVSTVTLTAGNASVTGQVNVSGNTTALYYFGDASGITDASYVLPKRGNINIQGNVISNGNVDAANVSANIGVINGNLIVAGQVTVNGGNVSSAGYFLGDGSRLHGVIPTFSATSAINIIGNVKAPGNVIAANVVANLLRVYGNAVVTGQVDASSNISANYFIGNGLFLTGVNVVLINSQVVNINGNVRASGNVDAANVMANNMRITGNVFVAGQVNVTGNVAAPFFYGNGLTLTGITATLTAGQVMNINGNVSAPANVNAEGVSANTILTVTGNAIITSQVNAIGNVVSSGFFFGSGSALTNVPATVTAGQAINIFGNVVAPGNVNAENVVANVLIVNGNVVVGGQVNITGNIVANTFTGIGNLLSNIRIFGTQNVNISGNVFSAGNVDASNIFANSLVVRGNAIITGQVDITGNISAPFYFGDGSRITNIPACTAPTSICFVQPSSGFTSNTFCLDYAPTNGWSFVLPSNGAPSTIGIQTYSLPLDPSRPFSQLPGNVTQTVSTPWAFSNGIWTSNVTLTSNGQFGPNTFNMGFSNFFGTYLGNSSNTAISSVSTPVNALGLVSNVFANLSVVNIVASYVNPNTGDISMCVAGTENTIFYPFMGLGLSNNSIYYIRCNKNFTTVNGFNIIATPTAGTKKGMTYKNQMSGYFVSETEMYLSLQSDVVTSSSNNLRVYDTNIYSEDTIRNAPFPYIARINPNTRTTNWVVGLVQTDIRTPAFQISISPDRTKVFTTIQSVRDSSVGLVFNYWRSNTTVENQAIFNANLRTTTPTTSGTLYDALSIGIWAANGLPINNTLSQITANVAAGSSIPIDVRTSSDAWSEDSNTAYYTFGSYEPANVPYLWRTYNYSSNTWTVRSSFNTGGNTLLNNLQYWMMRAPVGNPDTGAWVANIISIGNAFTPSYFIRPGGMTYSGEGNLWFTASIYKNTSYTGNTSFNFAGNVITTPTINTSGLGFVGLWKILDSNGSYSSMTLLSNSSEVANTSKYTACTSAFQTISVGRNVAKGSGVVRIQCISNISNISFITPSGNVFCQGLTNPSNTRLISFDVYPNLSINGFNALSNIVAANAAIGDNLQFGNAIDYNYSLNTLRTNFTRLNIDGII
ncbi:Chlorovirus glycoprotein repeat domain-containing protein [Paramecium bursaria Chlorella virus NW665.2]|nr:Chlorovirus glycoprotein repeat domain-containing protein [Paramecium bursaria Chlorella virus NW665.2]